MSLTQLGRLSPKEELQFFHKEEACKPAKQVKTNLVIETSGNLG
jgi:hypothetical protein